MRRNPSKKGLVTSIFKMILLAMILNISFLPQVTAHISTPTTMVTITPESGHIGDVVQIVGEINTTDGPYIIFFDEEKVKNGTATGMAVNDTFTVPPRPLGNYTITLHDVTAKSNYTSSELFSVQTAYFIKAVVPPAPGQLQEGESTKILVNVTGGAKNTCYSADVTVADPSGMVFYNDALLLTNTTNTGYGEGDLTYPADFGVGAHTNYTGVYHIALNETLATANFTVGLTDRQEYARRYLTYPEREETGEVVIRGSGYNNGTVTINITYYNKTSLIPVEGYPKQENASDGIVIHIWKIPDNATLSTYNVTLTSATTEKPIRDTQNFTIIEIIVSCQAQNKYDNKPLAGVSINPSVGILPVGSAITNETGWAYFRLDRGYYSFETYWRNVPVGSLSSSIEGKPVDYVLRTRFHIKCGLVDLTINITDKEGPIPFISVTLANVTYAPDKIPPLQTDYEGLASTKAFTDIAYRIEARRYGHLFSNQSIGNLTATPPPINITCPTYTIFIHVSDSKEHPIQDATVRVIEWSSGRIAGEGKTNEWGSVRLDCTFGRYKVRAYNYSAILGQIVMLNETIVDVIRNQFYLVLNCRTVNLDLSVKAIDYLGQPIPNARVILNLTTTEGMKSFNLTTSPDGTASKHEILGGHYRIALYVAGRLCRIKSLFLDKSEEITFRADNYVMIGGYPLERNQLIIGISLTVVFIFCASALIYRRHSKKS